MCGIAGLFDPVGRRMFSGERLASMTDSLAHRGPDGRGVFLAPGIALGHRRLSIIDLAGGKQPMQAGGTGQVVTFNGEIYNFLELRAELEQAGCRFETHSDTEVLLHGWHVWGEAMLPRLRGMFAFALYDPASETLILARDPLGKKPLHYATDDRGALLFGSEIKALLAGGELSRKIDPTAVEDFFALGYVPDPKTIYETIRKLPPAHAMIWQRGRDPRLTGYWSLPTKQGGQLGERDAEKRLLVLLRDAISRRLVADVPLGAFLSGGVDSSTVVALMAELAPGGVDTFSMGMTDADYDESAEAAEVALRFCTRHHTDRLDPTAIDPLDGLQETFDEPFGDPSATPTRLICAAARRALTVCLSGDGADEIFAGYRRYRFFLNEERVRAAVPIALRKPLFGMAAQLYPKLDWAPRFLRAKSTFAELASTPEDAYVKMVTAVPQATRRRLYSKSLSLALQGYDAREAVVPHFNATRGECPLFRAQYTDLMTYLPGDILTKVDRASMAHGLEVRAPFLDPELVRWALCLDRRRKIGSGEGKAILKRAMKGRLPHKLLYRAKRGFTVPLARWLRGPLNPAARQLGQSVALKESGLLDMNAVAALVAEHESGRHDHARALWQILIFERFLRAQQEARASAREANVRFVE